MGIWNDIIDAIRSAFRWIRDIFCQVIQGILNFAQHVLNWFKNLNLDPQEDVPFIAQGEEFKQMLRKAPRKNVGIFEGVYNEESDEITHVKYLDADSMDHKTRETLGNEPVVVLS